MKYFLIAGEASGDLHAAPLIEAIKQRDPDASFSGFGGDRMAAAGCTLYRHIRDLAFMGFVAVLKNISTIRRNFAIAKQSLLEAQPDVLILVDYPSFNLKMAKFARQHLPSLRIVYYIPPKVWAWKRWRRKTILRLCDQVLCIFPFEPSFYNDPKAVYVGNPTAEECLSAQRSFSDSGPTGDSRSCSNSGPSAQRSKIIALLPGSRRSEISHCLPKMLEAARRFPDYEIRIAQAPSIPTEFYEQILSTLNFETTLNSKLSTLNYDLLRTAAVSIVNSGTATLEAALLGCPQVAVYHIALPHLAGLIWKAVFTIRHFTLPNIILDLRDEQGRPLEVIRELLAYLFTVENIEAEVKRLLTDIPYRQTMLRHYDELRQILGTEPAASRAADYITKHGQLD